jgi:hypothetical protein
LHAEPAIHVSMCGSSNLVYEAGNYHTLRFGVVDVS